MKNKVTKTFFFFILLIMLSFQVSAQNYYVDNRVSSSGSGSLSSPFKTIDEGIDALNPGDTLHIRGSSSGLIYNEKLSTAEHGTSTNPITVKAYNNEIVIIQTDETMSFSKDYWIFDGLIIDGLGSNSDLFRIGNSGGAHHITFKNSEIRNTHNGDIFDVWGDYFTIENSKIHDTYRPGGFDAHCIVFNLGADHATIQDNEIYNCDGDGIQYYADDDNPSTYSRFALIKDNLFYNTPDYPSSNGVSENAIDIKGLSDSTITGNTMYNFPNYKAFVSQKGPVNLIVEHNIIYDSKAGFEFRGEDGYTQSGHIVRYNVVYDVNDYCLKFDEVYSAQVYHNTFHNCKALQIDNMFTGTFHNNLAYECSNPSGFTDQVTSSHNAWFGSGDGFDGTNNLITTQNPLFVDVNNNNYNLLPSSPAVDIGKNLGFAFNGAAPDAGAFESSGTSSCGNGILDQNEQCDDNNNINADGCNAGCFAEDKYFFVTVQEKTSDHPNFGTGSTHGFVINNDQSTQIILEEDQTYYFVVDSTASHPFYISTDNVGQGAGIYSQGVTNNFVTQGTLTFTPTSQTPNTLYYQCNNHQSMGTSFSITSSNTNPICGNNIIESPEQCDDGNSNGMVCDPTYGQTCTYCDNSCNTQSVQGAYCGDNTCDPQENSQTCTQDCVQIVKQLPINADFNTNHEDFAFTYDAFNTNTQSQQSGSWGNSPECIQGGCVSIHLNEQNAIEGGPFSSAWQAQFELQEPKTVEMKFSYNMVLSKETETGEQMHIMTKYSQAGQGVTITVDTLEHNVPGVDSTKQGTFTQTYDLSQGSYDFIVGCYLTQVSRDDEYAHCYIDDITIKEVSTTPTLLADINQDNVVNIIDFIIFSTSYPYMYDLNQDNQVNAYDLALIGNEMS